MCGFAGFIDPQLTASPQAWPTILTAMTQALAARGPDNADTWIDTDARVALGFRRLAVLDPSPAGNQPMVSTNGRFVLVFNGEIYNCRALRHALDQELATPWRGHSDTETLLEALALWGPARTLPKLDGMFALALWDRNDHVLTLARDRFGEKPLCYGWQSGVFLFGSTLAGLRPHPAYHTALDQDAVTAFFASGCVPAPHTIQRGMAKLLPGQWLQIHATDTPTTQPVARTYFNPLAAAEEESAQTPATVNDAVPALDRLIAGSVASRLHADVPVGVFLSGGIDSSTIAAHAAAHTRHRLKTFTISFPDSPHDEGPFARQVADHLGTDHHDMPVHDKDARDLITDIAHIYDEPFADPSAVPSMILSRQTRSAVTVALSGDGGDELFGGYARYTAAARDWARSQAMPAIARTAARAMAGIRANPWRKPMARRSAAHLADAYTPYVSRWRWDFPLITARPTPRWPPSPLAPEARFMAEDAMRYLPDTLQVKMDRASMGTGLEVRAPLLNEAIARFAWRLPLAARVHPHHGGKYILRQALARHLPAPLFERPKAGFYQPLPDWLRGSLRDWADDLLSPASLHSSGLIDARIVGRAWQAHQTGRNRALDLWTVLMFQHWLRAHT